VAAKEARAVIREARDYGMNVDMGDMDYNWGLYTSRYVPYEEHL
jgi:hypothetical protein